MPNLINFQYTTLFNYVHQIIVPFINVQSFINALFIFLIRVITVKSNGAQLFIFLSV